MLTDHRRALWWALALLAATVFVFVAVGRHPPSAAPRTSLPFLGEWDAAIARGADEVRAGPLTAVARVLSVLGSGAVTIPLRIVVTGWLVARRFVRGVATWILTWVIAEIALQAAKAYFHRGRPPAALVETVGHSFPSGHSVAAAAIAVAFVLVLMPPGRRRRRWELLAAAVALVMGTSRVYLLAHWFSDVVAGVLLGSGIAIACGAVVTEIADIARRRRAVGVPG